MKIILPFLLSVLFSISLKATEDVLLDFESSTVPQTVYKWLNYSNGGTASSVWGYPNPSSSSVNSTSGCYKITKLSNDPYWTGLEVTFNSSISITSSNQYLHVLVYKTAASRIALTYTPESGSQSSDLWQSDNTTGAWTDYVLAIPQGTNLKTISVKIADSPGVYYFDQIALSDNAATAARTEIKIDPSIKNQIVQGWGGSICWWGNIVGNYSDSKIKTVCDWITDPKNGLNMNIFRFNIGGGDDPTHDHMRKDGGAMPGYKASATSPYDWRQDSAQRNVLEQLIASRISKSGQNDIKLVAFSNSPPYWMTNSGCSAGSVTGTETNLRSDMFDDFADYLTEVVKHYHDSLGITFDYIEPFNEPVSTWWKANGGQEGCYFSNNDQTVLIRELYKKLQEKNMLSYCQVTANDANSIDECFTSVNYYKLSDDIIPHIPLIATHSYFGSNRIGLANFARINSKNLWQTESGPLNVGGTTENQLMTVSDRIIKDMNDLKCTAWIDWQLVADQSPTWGLICGEYNNVLNPVTKAVSFYIRAQFSRYVKQGYTIIGNSAENALTALSPDENELVIVISNKDSAIKNYNINLSGFSGFGKVTKIRTRADESLGVFNSITSLDVSGDSILYDAQPESVTTFIVPLNQPSAIHEIKKNGNFSNFYVSDGVLCLNQKSEKINDVRFFNMLGQCVSSYENNNSDNTFKLPSSKGLYIVKAEIDNKTQVMKIRVN